MAQCIGQSLKLLLLEELLLMVIFNYFKVMNIQVGDICLILTLMDKFTLDHNNNGCIEITILKDMIVLKVVDGISSSWVTKELLIITALTIMELILPQIH